MPCSDSSSGLNIRLNLDETFASFEFAKITCSSAIGANTGLNAFCVGKTLTEILELDFYMLRNFFNLQDDEEAQFILYMELDALKAGIAQFMGLDIPTIDSDRCKISSIVYTDQYIEIAEIILPPKELPSILPCSLKDRPLA